MPGGVLRTEAEGVDGVPRLALVVRISTVRKGLGERVAWEGQVNES